MLHHIDKKAQQDGNVPVNVERVEPSSAYRDQLLRGLHPQAESHSRPDKEEPYRRGAWMYKYKHKYKSGSRKEEVHDPQFNPSCFRMVPSRPLHESSSARSLSAIQRCEHPKKQGEAPQATEIRR